MRSSLIRNISLLTAGMDLLVSAAALPAGAGPATRDLTKAVVVIRQGAVPPAEATAARVLVEEVEKRTGLHWQISSAWPSQLPVIAISSGAGQTGWPKTCPHRSGAGLPEDRSEGFRLLAEGGGKDPAVIWIHGADSRGALFGVGQLLRSALWDKGSFNIPVGLDIATAPAQPIRGHQLGYRHTANSYDGWDDRKYEQYIRELALFGANSIENIPFQDERPSPLMPLPRDVMNRSMSEICARYELDYWIWAPADFDLKDAVKRAGAIEKHDQLYRDCPRLDGVFFPGGDPGDNQPQLVMPFLADLAKVLVKHHPRAKIWLSMQGFEKPEIDFVHSWINDNMPDWLGGLVGGPSSPPLPETRARLPQRYGLRDYPDITHTVRCQWPVAWWDPAFALTLGRECANPRPIAYSKIQKYFGPYTSGFISYSDGVHDDVNKVLWSRLAWEPEAEPREILLEYTRCFFGQPVAELAADGILALEKNWEGPLSVNGSVDATLGLWQKLEKEAPGLRDDWRWQLCLLRAYYDAYTRHRLLYESELERETYATLAAAPARGADLAMDAALGVLQRPDLAEAQKDWRARIVQLCADLFKSIKLQTSVPLYHASGKERGAVLDFIDRPLNNRWWLEDEFARIREMPAESEKFKAIEAIRAWENPGPGSFYDEVGNIAKSPHVVRGEDLNTDPLMEKNPNPTFWWWEEGSSRKRLSWLTSLDWPIGVAYHRLNPSASYRVRITGYGQAKVRGNGQLLPPTLSGTQVGEFKEFRVPAELVKDRKLLLTFDPLPEEAHLNWRQQSRASEVWLLEE
jgi:hypothetical protein